MERLLEAARWAPSSMNNQPWRFLSFGPENTTLLELARTVLKRGNSWALKAPRLMFILAKKTNPLAVYETGMAAAQMALQAVREGLVFHQMAGINRESLKEKFKLSDDMEILVAVAIGFPGSTEDVPAEKRDWEKADRERKPIKELLIVPQQA